MSLKFCDSFDHYAGAGIGFKWTQAGGTFSLTTAGGRNGTNGMHITANAAGYGFVRKVFSASQATMIAGVSWTIGDTTSGPIIGFDDMSAGGEQLSVQFNPSTNKLSVVRNGTALATGTTVLASAVPYYIELKATIDSAAGSYTLKINEVQELTAAGVNTRGVGTNNSADSVRLGGGLGFSIFGGGSFFNAGYFDDFYCCDGSGAVNIDFLGDVRVQCLFPNGAGATTGWTPLSGANYTNVDDTAADDDTTYVSTGAAGTIDTYAMTDLAATTGTVKGVQTVIDARKDDSGTRTIAPVLHIGATDYVGTNQNIMTSYSLFIQEYDVSPATAAAFTVAEVNALNFGPKLVA